MSYDTDSYVVKVRDGCVFPLRGTTIYLLIKPPAKYEGVYILGEYLGDNERKEDLSNVADIIEDLQLLGMLNAHVGLNYQPPDHTADAWPEGQTDE